MNITLGYRVVELTMKVNSINLLSCQCHYCYWRVSFLTVEWTVHTEHIQALTNEPSHCNYSSDGSGYTQNVQRQLMDPNDHHI